MLKHYSSRVSVSGSLYTQAQKFASPFTINHDKSWEIPASARVNSERDQTVSNNGHFIKVDLKRYQRTVKTIVWRWKKTRRHGKRVKEILIIHVRTAVATCTESRNPLILMSCRSFVRLGRVCKLLLSTDNPGIVGQISVTISARQVPDCFSRVDAEGR